jgi:hypothetical protein
MITEMSPTSAGICAGVQPKISAAISADMRPFSSPGATLASPRLRSARYTKKPTRPPSSGPGAHAHATFVAKSDTTSRTSSG